VGSQDACFHGFQLEALGFQEISRNVKKLRSRAAIDFICCGSLASMTAA